jgi:hypothetical protein
LFVAQPALEGNHSFIYSYLSTQMVHFIKLLFQDGY